jgi:endonuclease/exonuclease/phosphatase (EEP) superfamily protein YafD
MGLHLRRHNLAMGGDHIAVIGIRDPTGREGFVTDYSPMPDIISPEERSPPRAFGAFRRGLHAGLGLGGVALLVATFLPLLHPFWPLASVAEHFAFQILLGAVTLGLFALLLRRWRWLAIVGAVILIQLWTIHPYWPRFVTGAIGAQAGGTAQLAPGEIKIVSLNVHHSGDSYEAVRQYLSASNADIIGLVEMSRRWKMELAELNALYPYQIDCVDESACEEMLLSKLPFTRSGAGRVNEALPIMAWAEIAPPQGPPVIVAVSHVMWPLTPAAPPTLSTDPFATPTPPDLPRLVQAEQIDNLATGLRQQGPDLILMGDFNAAPWSRIQQYFRRATGLDNQGFGAPSWPNYLPALARIPIDHILTRGSPRLISFAAGPDVGSDHLPVEAIVALQGR